MKTAYVLATRGHQCEWGQAFASGLRRHGIEAEISAEEPASTGRGAYDLLVVWGVRRRAAIERQKREGGQVCVLERGYIGDRFKWTSVSFGGGLNGRGEFRGVSSSPERFETFHGHLKQPWRRKPGYALLIGQVPGDMSLAGVGGDLARWYAETTDALEDLGYEVKFRQHPLAGHGSGETLQEALSGAAICVTFNSNTGVESVLAGVPTVTMDKGSMAWGVSSHSLEQTETPCRTQWAAELAWKQWSLGELQSGAAWDRMKGTANVEI